MLRLRWILLAAVLGLCTTIMGTAYFLEIRKIRTLTERVDQRMEDLVAMSRFVQELREKVAFYSTPDGMAHIARDQFNFSYPGERVYKLEVRENPLPRKKP